MGKINFKRLTAAMLAAMMTVSSFGDLSLLAVELKSKASTQIESDKEIVYVNTYDGSVREADFNANWKFYLGSAEGAESNSFDDSRWNNVSLPHDYSIEQSYTPDGEAESAYLLGGTGWYRKHFIAEEGMEGKEVRINFGGVYMNATVWVNGTQLGTHPYGYTPFSFDITDYLNYGAENVITVKVDHQTPSSRWYSGSGIYRGVTLTTTDKVAVDLFGTQVTTPSLATEAASGKVTVNINTTIKNAGNAADVVLTHTIYEQGKETSIGTVTTPATNVEGTEVIAATLQANNPKLWDTENPNLYDIVTEVKVGGQVVDTYTTEFGFRYFSMDTETGFYLNGENVKLKGVCMHHDQGSLGAEAHYAAIERQVEILQQMGCNSIRVTHNPAATELIEICNEKGILVIDEFFDGWMYPKNGNYNDYAKWFKKPIEDGNTILGAEEGMTWAEFDLKAAAKRGLNAPSVIMWSLGNEIQEGAGGSGYNVMSKTLIEWTQEVDTSRIITIGSNAVKRNAYEHVDIMHQLTEVGGAAGTNYSDGASYDSLHAANPDWFIYGSETASSINSRGEYGNIGTHELTSYDESKVGWGALASAAWYDVITRDFVAGEYVWTGFDYMGEPTQWNGTNPGPQGTWPSPKNSYFGIIDTAGFPKDSYYLYQSQWNENVNTLHVLPAWEKNTVRYSNGKVPVVVYSDAASVELFFTAEGSDERVSLGKKTFTEKTTPAGYTYQIYEGADKNSQAHKNLYLTWNVAYADGTIEAVAYDKHGNVIENTDGTSVLTTFGEEAQLSATAYKDTAVADGKDLIYVEVDVQDAEGNFVADADDRVTFTVENGTLLGVDNGEQDDHQSFQDNNRKAYNGKVLAIVQTTTNAGDVKVTASAEGLEPSTVVVETTAVESEGTKQVEGFYMSKNYYVKAGNLPELPSEIEVRYTDGTTDTVSVSWNEYDEELVNQVGIFTVTGKALGNSLSVNINVISEVAGLLNYSTTTLRGVKPNLPETRPVVLVDGTVLDASFPVEWEEVTASEFEANDEVVVKGTSVVFGELYPLTATVRVQDAEITLGDSVSNAAYLTQDIPADKQSDTLDAIKDGSTTIGSNNNGGANTTAWTNYANSQDGDNTAEITFRYDTQQVIGQIVVHFFKDSYSARYPEAGTTKFFVSETGEDGTWTEVETNEVIGTESENVKPYTYEMAPVSATFLKLVITNNSVDLGNRKACTGITEVELLSAKSGNLKVNTSPELASLTINGDAVSQSALNSGVIYTTQAYDELVATAKANASITILDVNEGKTLIITESEDHASRNTYIIIWETEAPSSPDSDVNDYDVNNITATAGSEHPGSGNEGPIRLAFDNNANTWYHSRWGLSSYDINDLWVKFELADKAEITGIRYLPRTGAGNGTLTEYKVLTSEDGTNWTEVSTGTLERTAGWKLLDFGTTVNTKYIKLQAVHTYADSGNDQFLSAAELRLVEKAESAGSTGPVDKVELQGVIDDAKELVESLYTAESWASLAKAVAKAEAVVANEDATQTEVNAARDAILRAQEALEETEETPVVNKDALNAAITSAEALKADDYKDFSKVTAALAEAKAVAEDTEATQEEVDSAVAELEAAVKALVKKPAKKPFPFTDVSEKQWYYGVIDEAYQLGLLTGATDTLFKPNANMNRAMVACVFHRMEGSKPTAWQAVFSDVKSGEYYSGPITWAKLNGVINGYKNGTYKPLQNITREEMATMIYNFAKYKGLDVSATQDITGYTDYAKITPYARVTLQWAVENGLMSGKLNGTKLDPLGLTTRAEASKMLVNAYKVIYK